MPNQFFWHELITTDTKTAQKFYADVVGWTAQDAGVPGQDYTVLNANGQGVGGMLRITEEMAGHGARPAWLGYVSVDDADARAATVRRGGGKGDRAIAFPEAPCWRQAPRAPPSSGQGPWPRRDPMAPRTRSATRSPATRA